MREQCGVVRHPVWPKRGDFNRVFARVSLKIKSQHAPIIESCPDLNFLPILESKEGKSISRASQGHTWTARCGPASSLATGWGFWLSVCVSESKNKKPLCPHYWKPPNLNFWLILESEEGKSISRARWGHMWTAWCGPLSSLVMGRGFWSSVFAIESKNKKPVFHIVECCHDLIFGWFRIQRIELAPMWWCVFFRLWLIFLSQ